MMLHYDLLGKRRLAVLVIAVIALHACAETPVAPSAATRTVPRPLRSLSYIDPTTSIITVVDDDDGTQYTLNPATNEIAVSDGSYIELDPSQTPAFVATFRGIVETDQIVPSMSDLTLDCTLYGMPGKDGRGCNQEERITLPGATISAVSLDGAATNPATILWRRAATVPALHGIDRTTAMHSTLGPTLSLGFGDPCVDILNSVAGNISIFSRQRTSVLQTAMELATAEVVARDASVVLERTLPLGSGAAAAVITKIADAAAARVSVSILAYVWNANSCGTHIPVAQITLPGSSGGSGSGSGSGGGITCHLEGWEISFDGGNTWNPITVKVCQYAME